MHAFTLLSALLAAAAWLTSPAWAQDAGTIIRYPSDLPADLNGSNFTYGHPISLYRFTSQGQDLDMAFLDVPPCAPRRHRAGPPPVAVLLHGKNFCSVTWNATIASLSAAGYRVIAPDQVGFCKSTKPAPGYQFSLSQLALNTHALLTALGVLPGSVTLVGHSMGGMLATRFALQYPAAVAGARAGRLVLVNPIGLEDYIAEGVPYTSVDANRAQEAASDYGSIRAYQESVYYPGTPWREAFDVWVRMSAAVYGGTEREAFLDAQARVVDMVLTQPVAHEFGNVRAGRTLVVIGERDTTAIGAAGAAPEVRKRLGRFDVLGPEVAATIPRAEYAPFPDCGHAPQIEEPEAFHEKLVSWLGQ